MSDRTKWRTQYYAEQLKPRSPEERTAQLYGSVGSWGSDIALRAALAAGADPNAKPPCQKFTPIVRAVLSWRRNAVGYLLKAGADPNSNKGLALRRTVERNDYRLAIALLEAGADPHVNADEPLMCAIYRGRPRLARLLLSHGADPNCRQGEAVRVAIYDGSTKILTHLISAGAVLKSKNFDALFRCAYNQSVHLKVLRIVLDAGAEPSKTFRLRMPNDLSEKAEFVERQFKLLEALLDILNNIQERADLKRRVLLDFSSALNTWNPVFDDNAGDHDDYNDIVVRIHRRFIQIAGSACRHVPRPDITALML